MASEADYSEEIHSPDSAEEGEADDSEEDDRSEVAPDDEDDPALNGSGATSERPPTPTPTVEGAMDVDSSSGDIRSPSSDPGEEEALFERDGDIERYGSESRSSGTTAHSDEMSVRSPSTGQSPDRSQPQSPSRNGDDPALDVPSKSEQISEVGTLRQQPIASEKGPLEDQEGELDFEEETPEERRDGAEPALGDVGKPAIESGDPDEEVPADQSREEGEEDELEEGEEGSKSGGAAGDGGDPDDDGEVEDDDDLEEGEVKDGYVIRKQSNRTICRFFMRSACTWGNDCRFLHPGINDKGNYSMFSSHKPLVPSNGPGFGWHSGSHRTPYTPRPYVEPAPLPPPPPPVEEPVVESAWERGLRHAKEILKKSSKRKETEPDFEEKRMNLGLSVVAGDNSNEYEKENDYYGRSPYDLTTDPYSAYSYDDAALDPYERQAQDYWRGGNYENFEVRYTRNDFPAYRDQQHDRLRERAGGRERPGERFHDQQRDRERGVVFREQRGGDLGGSGGRGRRGGDKFERQRSPERNWREERYADPGTGGGPPSRGRGDEWRDPWRRSTSPKRRHHLSRSFSSHSSASYSSSRSSVSRSSSYTSHSRSSSGSSGSSYSSRSYSHSRSKTPVRRKGLGAQQPPPPSGIGMHVQKMRQSLQHQPQVQQQQPGGRPQHPPPGTKPHGRTQPPQPPPPAQRAPLVLGPMPPAAQPPTADRKKTDRGGPPPSLAAQRRRPSSSGSESASRSRGRAAKLGAWAPGNKANKSASRSRSSRSRSTSISSLESVSSKSSLSSKSSFGSGKNAGPKQALAKKGDKRPKDRDRHRIGAPLSVGAGDLNWKGPPRQAGRDQAKLDAAQADLRVKSSVSAGRTSKDLLKQSGQKPQIKLTLLNKSQERPSAAPPSSMFEAPEMRTNKPKPPLPISIPEKEAPKVGKGPIVAGKKRPLPSPVREGTDTTTAAGQKVALTRLAKAGSPSPPGSPPSGSGKKSTSSRREELLKQLKAVEDAIARKRSKLS